MATRTELVGILNVTPDSFSDGGQFVETDKVIQRVNQLFAQGANIVDIGAESTRPGATPLPPEAEWARLEPLIPRLSIFRGKLSFDTYHPETVQKIAARIGNFILNDVTGFNNPDMIEKAAELDLTCVVSHLPHAFGQDIQAAHRGMLINNLNQVKNELLERREQMINRGIDASKIILDPGIGFGKSGSLNQRLLKFAEEVPDIDVMIGYSRKRFLGKDRMEPLPNLRAGVTAIKAGTKYLRVHDVRMHRNLIIQIQGD